MTPDWQPITPEEFELLFERPLEDESTHRTLRLGFAEEPDVLLRSSSESAPSTPHKRRLVPVVCFSTVLFVVLLVALGTNRSQSTPRVGEPSQQLTARLIKSGSDPATSLQESTTNDPSNATLIAPATSPPRQPSTESKSAALPLSLGDTTTASNHTSPTVRPETEPDRSSTTIAREPAGDHRVAKTAPTQGQPAAVGTTTTASNDVAAVNIGTEPPESTSEPGRGRTATPPSTTSRPTTTTTELTTTTTTPSTTEVSTTIDPPCHPAYTGVCVPFASDVDCNKRGGGRGGNGPEFVSGPLMVVDPEIDPYKLDPDGDGIACDK